MFTYPKEMFNHFVALFMSFNRYHELQQYCFVHDNLKAYNCLTTWDVWEFPFGETETKRLRSPESQWQLQHRKEIKAHKWKCTNSKSRHLNSSCCSLQLWASSLQFPHLQMGASMFGFTASQGCPEDQVSEECGERTWHSDSWWGWKSVQLSKQHWPHFPLWGEDREDTGGESGGERERLAHASQ